VLFAVGAEQHCYKSPHAAIETAGMP